MTSTLPVVTSTAAAPAPAGRRTGAPALDVVVPVHNEAAGLAASIHRLHGYLSADFPVTWRITVADNASTDDTWSLALQLSRELPHVRVLGLREKGRGRALHAAWSSSDATVLAYMDVDLSTDLDALLPLVAPLLSGHSDLAVGSRLASSSRVVRGAKRELISRSYNTILRTTLGVGFSDAQCGFKAIRRDRAAQLLPLVEDQAWFFDTELLVLAERAGLRVHEVPVDWVDDPDSRVDIVPTAIADLKGVARLARGLATGRIPLEQVRPATGPAAEPDRLTQVLRFAAIGALSTLAYLMLYVVARTTVSPFTANAFALVLTAVGNTSANRRLTFGVRGRQRLLTHQLQGLAVLAVALVVTTGSLALLHHSDPSPGRGAELVVLVVANLAATVLRFLLLRGWVFRR